MLFPWQTTGYSSAWWLDALLLLQVWVTGNHSAGVPERQKSQIRLWRDKSLNFSSLPPLCGWLGGTPWLHRDSREVFPACPVFLSFTRPGRRGPVAVMCFWKFIGRWKIRWKFSLAFWAQPAGHSVNLEGLCLCQQESSAESSAQIQLCGLPKSSFSL